jgi:hypothetical protein
MRRFLVCGAAIFAVLTAASSAQSTQTQTTTGAGPTNGGACRISGGTNTGKGGTYDTTSDPGHVWCCTRPNGGGSCTECSSTGGGRCTASRTARTHPGMRPPAPAVRSPN